MFHLGRENLQSRQGFPLTVNLRMGEWSVGWNRRETGPFNRKCGAAWALGRSPPFPISPFPAKGLGPGQSCFQSHKCEKWSVTLYKV